ncbi:hypothetical protein LX36DRAFT_181417 [Colletotrichum falcatum]|nr:hypothetical protein LX36DRAFT_181417 [Colletotrichum falcatum]
MPEHLSEHQGTRARSTTCVAKREHPSQDVCCQGTSHTDSLRSNHVLHHLPMVGTLLMRAPHCTESSAAGLIGYLITGILLPRIGWLKHYQLRYVRTYLGRFGNSNSVVPMNGTL